MSARKSGLQEYKNHAEMLVLRMQFFCLDPKYANYKEICAYPKIQHDQSEYIGIWKLACLTQYGKFWDIPESELLESKRAFTEEMRKLSSRLLIRPTSGNLDRMWYVFFATGDINALRAAFEVSGNGSAKKDLRIAASDQFANFRDEYKRRIQDALDKDPNYFRNHEIPMLDTQTVFDRFQAEIDKATAKLDDDDPEVRGVLTRIGGLGVEDVEAGTDGADGADGTTEPAEPKAGNVKEEKRISDLANKFDEIAKDVLGDKYMTKSTAAPKKHRK